MELIRYLYLSSGYVRSMSIKPSYLMLLGGVLILFSSFVVSKLVALSSTGKNTETLWVDASNWKPAKPLATEVKAPAMGKYKVYNTVNSLGWKDTNNRVWRLGGSPVEMYNALKDINIPNGEISEAHAQHWYSRTTPTNHDESYVLGAGTRKSGFSALWRLSDKKLVAWVPSVKHEMDQQQRQLLWDKKENNVYWYTQKNDLIKASINFTTYKVKTEVWDTFPNYQFVTFGFGEGGFSDNGQRVVLAGKKEDGLTYFFPYVVTSKRILPSRKLTHTPNEKFDWVSVDPSGQYIVFTDNHGGLKTLVVPFWSAAKSKPVLLYQDTKHSDFVVDASGTSWLVHGDWRGLFASRLADGFNKKVWPDTSMDTDTSKKITVSGHVSRVANKPGVVLVSRNEDGGFYFMNIDKPGKSYYVGNAYQGIGPKEAHDSKSSEKWGVNLHGEVTSYHREPRGSASSSGKYVFFVSDYWEYEPTHSIGYQVDSVIIKAYLNVIEVNPPL